MARNGGRGSHPKARAEGLIAESVGDELLVYDLERDRAHALNESAALVFRHCDGERSVAKLVDRLREKTGRPVDEAVVLRALQRLEDSHLLVEHPTEAPAGPGWSRREALRRIGVAGAAAGLGLPVVKSIVAPTSVHAQFASCFNTGSYCGEFINGVCDPQNQFPPCCTGSCLQLQNVAACTCQ
jgi:hypothetical protein